MFKLRQTKDEIVRDAKRTVEVLTTERQALWSVLRLSTQQRFQYTMQLVAPSLCEPVAAELDEELWRMFEACTGFTVPRGQEQGGLSLRVPVPGLDHRSFQEWAVRLPVWFYCRGAPQPSRLLWSSIPWCTRDCNPLYGRHGEGLPGTGRALGWGGVLGSCG